MSGAGPPRRAPLGCSVPSPARLLPPPRTPGLHFSLSHLAACPPAPRPPPYLRPLQPRRPRRRTRRGGAGPPRTRGGAESPGSVPAARRNRDTPSRSPPGPPEAASSSLLAPPPAPGARLPVPRAPTSYFHPLLSFLSSPRRQSSHRGLWFSAPLPLEEVFLNQATLRLDLAARLVHAGGLRSRTPR